MKSFAFARRTTDVARKLSLCGSCGLLVAACSVTEPVLGLMGDGSELYRGEATGYMGGYGDISLKGEVSGVGCFGGFTYTRMTGGAGSTGVADIQCEDGRSATVKFVARSFNVGMGSGVDNFGKPFFFVYGMTDEEAIQVFEQMKRTFDQERGVDEPEDNREEDEKETPA